MLLAKVARPMWLARSSRQASLLLLPDHSTQPHFDRHSTKAPIAPAPPHAHLSTPHNGRVHAPCSCATRIPCELTPDWRAAPTQSYPVLTASSWVFRENNVPKYQAYFQKHDGLRTWEKVRVI
jgi:hypothetical protein